MVRKEKSVLAGIILIITAYILGHALKLTPLLWLVAILLGVGWLGFFMLNVRSLFKKDISPIYGNVIFALFSLEAMPIDSSMKWKLFLAALLLDPANWRLPAFIFQWIKSCRTKEIQEDLCIRKKGFGEFSTFAKLAIGIIVWLLLLMLISSLLMALKIDYSEGSAIFGWLSIIYFGIYILILIITARRNRKMQNRK